MSSKLAPSPLLSRPGAPKRERSTYQNVLARNLLPFRPDSYEEYDADGEPMFARCMAALGALERGECYGFFPASASADPFGQARSVESVRRVRARALRHACATRTGPSHPCRARRPSFRSADWLSGTIGYRFDPSKAFAVVRGYAGSRLSLSLHDHGYTVLRFRISEEVDGVAGKQLVAVSPRSAPFRFEEAELDLGRPSGSPREDEVLRNRKGEHTRSSISPGAGRFVALKPFGARSHPAEDRTNLRMLVGNEPMCLDRRQEVGTGLQIILPKEVGAMKRLLLNQLLRRHRTTR